MASAQTKLSVGEKLEKALEFKEVGNSMYKEGNYKDAAKKYHRAILYLKVSFKVNIYLMKRIKQMFHLVLRVSYHSLFV